MDEAKTKCKAEWQKTVQKCHDILQGDDFKRVEGYETPEHLSREIQKLESRSSMSSVPRTLSKFRSQISNFKIFTFILLYTLEWEDMNKTCIWGTMGLLLELACQSEKALTEITKVLSEISQALQLFEIYSKHIALNPDLVQAFFDILVEMVTKSAEGIQLLRKKNTGTTIPVSKICENYKSVLDEIKAKVDHMKEVAQAKFYQPFDMLSNTNVLQQLASLQISSGQHGDEQPSLSLPCYTLPFQRNPLFTGRTQLLSQISNVLEPERGHEGLRSIAIWGTGGIGKSQIALEYANSRITAGTPIVLWIACETEAEILKSFNRVAQELKPPGYALENTADNNKKCVQLFLQRTQLDWLIVFDNVENIDLLQQNWPTSGNGSIMVTCRSEIAALAPAAESLEVTTFSDDEGSQLVLRFYGKLNNATEDDVDCAKRLSHKVGGLALALELMGKAARIRKKTLSQFLKIYEENHRLLEKPPRHGPHNPYYDKALGTVWSTSFSDLSDDARDLLSLLCFVAPDDIPRSLFEVDPSSRGGFGPLDDDEMFEEVLLELQDQSLIRINSETSLMSLHRLIRNAFWDAMDLDSRIKSFRLALKIFNEKFPSKNAAGHMYDRHQTCQQLIQHVQAFVAAYLELRKIGFTQKVDGMTDMLCSAAWYLREVALLNDSQSLLESALTNVEDKSSKEYAEICNGMGSLAADFAHYVRAATLAYEQVHVAELHGAPGSFEVAFAHGELAYILPGLWQNEEAIKHGELTIAAFKDLPESEAKSFHPDRFHRNCGRAYFFHGDFAMARKHLDEAYRWATVLFGEGTFYHAEVCYLYGRIAAEQNDLDTAEHWYSTAYDNMSKQNPMAPPVAATQFQRGRIRLQQKNEDALRYFHDALKICKRNETAGNKGETARVQWWMSKALERDGLRADAQSYLEEAVRTKDALYATGNFAPPKAGVEDFILWEGLVGVLYR